MTNLFRHYKLNSILLVCCSALLGCGPSSPVGVNVGGTVSVNGQPSSYGSINFAPDIDQGNSGPTVTVMIAEGKFSADPSQGILPGQYKLGFDLYGPVAQMPEGEIAWEDRVKYEPKHLGNFEQTIEIPADGKTDFVFEFTKGRR